MHNKINQIIELRNKLVHPKNIWENKLERRQDIFLRYILEDEEKSLLLNFNDCNDELIKAHSIVLTEKPRLCAFKKP